MDAKNHTIMEKIDFVMIWVDGNDPEWQKEYNRYSGKNGLDENSTVRYRDWDLLKYWFRGVEKFAPWVNRVHFVTCGQKPEWLNPNAPKLNLVSHSDYMPAEHLPTFSSHPIEINLHRIDNLADKFVYFNDDCFILNHLPVERFFRNGLPCDRAGSTIIEDDGFEMANHVIKNNVNCINRHFNKKESIRKNWYKWFNIRYATHPRCMLHTLQTLPNKEFIKFSEPHFPNAFLKSTLQEVWDKCGDTLEQTSASKFRNFDNINQWLFRDWQIAKGCFSPYDVYKDSISFEISDSNIERIENIITKKKKRLIILNDSTQFASFSQIQSRLNRAMESILPEKCSFEI